MAAGVGGRVDLMVGGKVDSHHGTPQHVTGKVRLITDGTYRAYDEKVHAGHKVFDGGRRAVVETDGGGTIQLTALPVMTMSLDQHYTAGTTRAATTWSSRRACIRPSRPTTRSRRGSSTSTRPGISTADMRFLGHQHRRRPMFPFEPDTVWP